MGGGTKCPDRFLFAIAYFDPPSPQKMNKKIKFIILNASWGVNYKISWSNDDLERFLKIRALCAPPHESIRYQGTMADRARHARKLKFGTDTH